MSNTKKNIPLGISHNALSTSTTITGNIKTSEDFRLDGKMQGDIESDGKVIIGPEAEFTGNIICQNIDLMGRIQGNLTVSETTSLKAKVNFQGEITTRFLDIEPGALFNGSCKMTE